MDPSISLFLSFLSSLMHSRAFYAVPALWCVPNSCTDSPETRTDACVEPSNLPAVFKAMFSSITSVAYTDYSEPVHLLIC